METIKINETYSVTVGTKDVGGETEFFHYINKDGLIFSKITVNHDEQEYKESVADSVSYVIAELVNGNVDVEAQVFVEGFEYKIWVAVEMINNKIVYNCSTVSDYHNGFDANNQTRKTFKGLVNYVNKFC